jgi:hypothetical protein|tara:strand:- start:1059 stop:1592 length:534 start_codon:yes stop_codon:yes gene_type:complete
MKITKDIEDLWLELLELEEFPKDFGSNEKWRFSICEKEDFLKLQSISKEYKNKTFKDYVDFVSKRFEEGHYISPTSLLENAFNLHLGKSKWRYTIPCRISSAFEKDYEPIYLCEQLLKEHRTFHQILNQLGRAQKELKKIQLELEEGCFPEEIMGCLLEERNPHRGFRARQPYWWGY